MGRHKDITDYFNELLLLAAFRESGVFTKGESSRRIGLLIVNKRIDKSLVIPFSGKDLSFLYSSIKNMIKFVVCKNYLLVGHEFTLLQQ